MGTSRREDNTAKETWSAVLGELQLQLPSSAFATWLKDTAGLAFADGKLVVSVPNAFTSEWLEQRAYQLVQRTASKIVGQPLDVAFRIENPPTSRETDVHSRPAPRRPAAAPLFQTGFPNRRYSFDSFVVGPSNSLSYNAALAVASSFGQNYNPLFIYSGVGLGKTHLLHAIAHRCRQQSINYLYVTSEQFTNEFIAAIRKRSTEEFRSRYRSVDVLLMDDIQFMSSKEQTLEGFFHTFNDLHNTGRQIVLTSDKSPKTMPYLEDRIRSRYSWGLTTDIQAPSLETKVAILQTKAKEMNVTASNDVLTYIAERTGGSVRDLEGALNRVAATARIAKGPITLSLVKGALEEKTVGRKMTASSPEKVLEAIEGAFQVDQASLTGSKRRRDFVVARHAAMYIMREHLKLTVSQIGRAMGGKNHATVIHGIRRVDDYLESVEGFRAKVEAAKEHLSE